MSSRNPVATALLPFWSSWILNSSTFKLIAFVLVLGSSSVFHLAFVEFIQLIWAVTDCSNVSLVCFIITSIRFMMSSIFASHLLDALSFCGATSLSFTWSIPLISLHEFDDFLFTCLSPAIPAEVIDSSVFIPHAV